MFPPDPKHTVWERFLKTWSTKRHFMRPEGQVSNMRTAGQVSNASYPLLRASLRSCRPGTIFVVLPPFHFVGLFPARKNKTNACRVEFPSVAGTARGVLRPCLKLAQKKRLPEHHAIASTRRLAPGHPRQRGTRARMACMNRACVRG